VKGRFLIGAILLSPKTQVQEHCIYQMILLVIQYNSF